MEKDANVFFENLDFGLLPDFVLEIVSEMCPQILETSVTVQPRTESVNSIRLQATKWPCHQHSVNFPDNALLHPDWSF